MAMVLSQAKPRGGSLSVKRMIFAVASLIGIGLVLGGCSMFILQYHTETGLPAMLVGFAITALSAWLLYRRKR